MRVVVQRVERACVRIDDAVHGSIERGLLIFVGCTHGDSAHDVARLAHKVAGLRIFSDDEGKMNRSVTDIDGALLVVSQFTLYGSSRKGYRPSFTEAMEPEAAERLYEQFVDTLKASQIPVETGVFGADMRVELVNDGPVTLIIESKHGSIVDPV